MRPSEDREQRSVENICERIGASDMPEDRQLVRAFVKHARHVCGLQLRGHERRERVRADDRPRAWMVVELERLLNPHGSSVPARVSVSPSPQWCPPLRQAARYLIST